MGISDVFRTDLTLLHAPSVYDFRKKTIMQGPVAEAVPSTQEFEMYPVGLTSIASYLGKNQYNVRVVNLAYRMLRDPGYDVEARLRRMRSTVFGIDLHWLPHANGALAVAEIVKRVHPESFVLMGGLSSSYYHEELIKYPFVDFVLRGDSTEEPCRQLLHAIRTGGTGDAGENLSWKRPGGEVVENPLTFIPDNLDYIDIPDYLYAIRLMLKYRSMEDLSPYLRWLEHPTTMLLNSRGCTLDCSTCGGSRSAYQKICERSWPAFRSPEKLVSDVKSIAKFSRSPIVMIHDPRLGGLARAQRFFSLLKKEEIPNEFVFELFYPAGDDYFQMVEDSVKKWSIEVTIETADERLRKLDCLKFPVPNSRVEATIASALSHGCRKLDLFFMVGIPHQTYQDAMGTVSYCEGLIQRFNSDRRLQFYISPMGPFLDPGCGAFEDPKYGYKHFYLTLEDHRQALLQPTWKSILSYETDAMTRPEIIAASYDAGAGLNEIKFKYGLIDERTYRWVKEHQTAAQKAMEGVDFALQLPEDQRGAALEAIEAKVRAANDDTLFSKEELEWEHEGGVRVTLPLVETMVVGFAQEANHGLHRLLGSYDTAVYTGKRIPLQAMTMEAFKELNESGSGTVVIAPGSPPPGDRPA
ncbi:MAG: TIGR04190 family B12-binding domain/radical SAM domain protein [Nitrososphaerales archaeon]